MWDISRRFNLRGQAQPRAFNPPGLPKTELGKVKRKVEAPPPEGLRCVASQVSLVSLNGDCIHTCVVRGGFQKLLVGPMQHGLVL